MTMGVLGGVAVWFLIGAGIISGSRLAMARDREVAVIGLVLACALVAYALIGAVDVGFFWYRIAFITGTLLGLAEAARRLTYEPPAPTSARRSPPLKLPFHRASGPAVGALEHVPAELSAEIPAVSPRPDLP
jgi:hypothetical protein